MENLDFNLSKCSFLVAGNPKARRKLQGKVDKKPLLLCKSQVKQVAVERYLGCQVAGSVADSVSETVSKRAGLAKRSIYESRYVVDDNRADAVGGLTLSFLLFESSVAPMLFFGCEVWSVVPKKTMNMLEKICLLQMRVALGIGRGQGFIIPCLYFECGMLLPKYRILQQKLMFYYHVFHLPDTSLAKKCLNHQIMFSLPGVATECRDILDDWKIGDLKLFTKVQFKKLIKDQIISKNEKE